MKKLYMIRIDRTFWHLETNGIPSICEAFAIRYLLPDVGRFQFYQIHRRNANFLYLFFSHERNTFIAVCVLEGKCPGEMFRSTVSVTPETFLASFRPGNLPRANEIKYRIVEHQSRETRHVPLNMHVYMYTGLYRSSIHTSFLFLRIKHKGYTYKPQDAILWTLNPMLPYFVTDFSSISFSLSFPPSLVILYLQFFRVWRFKKIFRSMPSFIIPCFSLSLCLSLQGR